MTIRFFRRQTLIPGVLRLNFSKSGVSLSIGHRGLGWLTVGGPRGNRITAGLPGTGLFVTQIISPPRPARVNRLAIAALVVLVLALVVWALTTSLS